METRILEVIHTDSGSEFLQGVVAHSFNVEDEAGRSPLIQDQPGVHSKTLWKERRGQTSR